MFVAKFLLFALLAWPAAELLVFILVGYQIGFAWALILVLATSLIGGMVLRSAGGAYIARARVVMGPQRLTALQADSTGFLVLLAGFLLLLPGFISDLLGLVLLIAPLRRWLGAKLGGIAERHATQSSDVVDLAPEEWRHEPEAQLSDERRPRPPR
jgi:UPF0716 protein FxsA